MTNDEIGERGRLARCVTRLAGRYRESFSAGRRKERARRPRSPLPFSGDIPPAFVPRLRDYRLAGDFPPSLRYGAAGARNNKNGM